MNIIDEIISKNFQDKDQFKKREIVNEYILQSSDCKIGMKVICYELETIILEKNKHFYQYHGKNTKIKSLTIGKEYKILDFKDDKIKVEGDSGQKLWYTPMRFLYSLKLVRKMKLEKLDPEKKYNSILEKIPIEFIEKYIKNQQKQNF